MRDLVTVLRCHSAIEARLARARLSAQGIHSFIANENSATVVDPELPIELQVTRDLEGRALQILEEELRPAEPGDEVLPEQLEPEPTRGPWSPPADDPERCLVCQSSFVRIEPPSLALRLFRLLLTEVLPLPDSALRGRGRACGVCGHRWKAGDARVTQIPTTWR